MDVFIIPLPRVVKPVEEQFLLTRETCAYVAGGFDVFADDILFALRKIFTSFSGKVISNEGNMVILGGINFIVNKYLEEEEYTLLINNSSITLTASTPKGFFNASASLKQLLCFPPTKSESISIDGVYIEDKPKFSFRGFMLDESRNFFGKADVKRILDVMAWHKLNKFIWHLSDDQGYRLESKFYPELNSIGSSRHDTQVCGWRSKRYKGAEHGGFYTAADIKEIVDYAADRNIEIIPELELPFHTGAIMASIPELDCNGKRIPVPTNFDCNYFSCLSKPDSMNIVTNIIDEWCRLFPSEYIHLGGDFDVNANFDLCDECKSFMALNDLADIKDLASYYYNILSDYIYDNYGKRIIIRDTSYTPLLNENIILQVYTLNNIHKIIPDIPNGRKLIMTPANSWHFDYPYSITPMTATYSASPIINDFIGLGDYARNILGGAGAMWTEWIYDREKLDFNCNPRLAAVAEKTWSDHADYRNFVERFYNISDIYDSERIGYAKKSMLKPVGIRQMRDSWLWLHIDQYSEVRRNRKK